MAIRASLPALALVLACIPPTEPNQPSAPTPEARAEPDGQIPEHLAPIVEGWTQTAFGKAKVAAADGRAGPKRGFRWTKTERAELEDLRSEAREAIARANAEDRPWLLAGYAGAFAIYGMGAEWADALLEAPPEHPVWATELAWGLYDALEETSAPARLRAHVHAAAAAHGTPLLDAQSTYLQLEDADRAGDWPLARELHAQLESIQVPRGSATVSAAALLDVSSLLDPARPLRADTKVPNYCAPTILGPHAGARVCLDEQFPHGQPTLIVGWASWCGPCNEQLPEVIELVRDGSLRVIAISYDEDAETAREHLREHGIDDWTVLLPRAERPKPTDAVSLDFRPIPFLALVDEQGQVEAGPPWLDVEALAGRLR